LTTDLVCFSRPWVPFIWPRQRHPSEPSLRNFSSSGDLPDPLGSRLALDSAWRAREGSMNGGTGDPGRMLREVRKEHRDSVRRAGHVVPFHQIEFYDQTPATRGDLYVPQPTWWEQTWVSQNMFVPLPLVATYKASAFLSRNENATMAQYWWQVFEAEWTVLMFARWCADIPQRSIMRRLPERISRNVQSFTIEVLLQGSPYQLADVRAWLSHHQQHPWHSLRQVYRVRGPTAEMPALDQEISAFVK
jgi:hypothetical protein